jgi:HK97 family phage major capsid protein
VILVGDLRAGYLLTNIHQLKITVDNISAPGFYKWYVRQRVGGIVADNDAIKCING